MIRTCLLRVCGLVKNSPKNVPSVSNDIHNLFAVDYIHPHLLKTHIPLVHSTRNTTFFVNKSADELWKGVTTVSNAGRRRGRAKGLKKKKDLNKGQIIGVGKVPMQFPGLNTPVFRGKELVQQQKLPVDPKREENLAKLRQIRSMGPKRMKLSPLERGWTSAQIGGRKVGPPDPIGEDTFDGFDTWILESKMVNHMTGNLGRRGRISIFVVTGNGNGVVGFSLAKAPVQKTAIKTAKNRAGQRLMYISRCKEHTVLHDFVTQFGNTKIFVKKMHEGYGLVCHRAIKACCEAIGIKDIHAKVEGSINLQHIVKAFFIGLLQQKSYQQLADEKRLHLVEFKSENGNYPEVVASPSKVRKLGEIKSNEILDFTQYVLGGKIVLKKKKYPPFYTKHPLYKTKLVKLERLRNFDETRIKLMAEYGALHSFLTEKYPEAKLRPKPKRSENNETEE
ncbi:28S ribosomal protein S5, mitochondrial [Trachymyrmex septentrionalis]|uniref:Small ribosomal subunit protein uS5m n=1 Tax=Trachymyrmex septentrionalis TaxID=34720 RepID=A0A195ETL8_9HYME|nr:PREDICTED: 28S ribosomal protein S5, mitochondrial [Trachymyrmex septentrionalis]KYN31252.1 28S ribosomal protein S5, mitochondrial [Trachymyrmex septentrionalis]